MQLVLSKNLQCHSYMFLILFFIPSINKNFIQEHYHKLVQILAKSTIHEAYKCSGFIGKTKWHHRELIMAISCSKSCLVNVLLLYPHLMIP